MRARLFALLGAVLSLAAGVGLAFLMDAVGAAIGAPHARGHWLQWVAFPLMVLSPFVATFFLGLAIVPTRVREAGRHRAFAGACVLVGTSIPCFLYVWFCFVTWPLGLVLLAVAGFVFRYSLRRDVLASAESTRSSEPPSSETK